MSTFDLRSLRQLLCDFYTLTGIKTCLYDSEGNELCFYPTKLNRFCELLREDSASDLRCKNCDRQAFAHCRTTRKQYVYTCHAGLQECVSPIFSGNEIVGFIMIGQIKKRDAVDFSALEARIPEPLRDQLRLAYDNLAAISDEKLLSASRILDACANYELLKTLAQIDSHPIEAQLEKYIHEHLSKPLSISLLCSEFHLSRHEIYQICNEYFYCPPAKYIKSCRLTYACKLLSTTDLPIHKIAVLCGMEDYNYFSKVFKSTYQISPTAYRKNHLSRDA